MDKLTIIFEHANQGKVTLFKEGYNLQSLAGVLETFQEALILAGFSFEGNLAIVNEDGE